MKTKKPKNEKLFAGAVMGVVGVFVSLIFIFTYRFDSYNQPAKQIVLPHKPAPGSDAVASRQRMAGNQENSRIEAPPAKKVQARNTHPTEQTSPSVSNTGNEIVKGVGLSENALKALHLKQIQEMQKMAEDRDSIVTVPSQEGIAAITLGELLALHRQQHRDMEGMQDFDEIVVASSDETQPALSRRDLIELHKQQKLVQKMHRIGIKL